ncbi:MAG: D-aminoacylase [Gemmatimonadota bacterium]|nr:MAG: D-aminoacylase [Gemmatimonadota bacterium]
MGLALRRPLIFAVSAALAGGIALAGCAERPEAARTTLISNAVVVDGTGGPARTASVRIRGERIVEVGELQAGPDETVVDATGLALAPGFIDTHSHHDRGLSERPEVLAAVSQGITTVVVGQDGESYLPLAEYFGRLAKDPPAINVASFVGHGTLRNRVLGEDFRRPATPAEIDEMRVLLRQELEAGALGLSTGLEYDPGIYSETEEVIALAQEAAQVGGRYVSHIRSEDRRLWEAIEEIIRIGQEAAIPVQVSHMKLAMRSLWGQADRLLQRLDEARAAGVEITADVYPYEYWQSTMTVLFPNRDFDNRESAAFALLELAPPEGLLLARFDPDTSYVGKTVAEVAELRGTDPVTTYMDLIAESQALWQETGESVESVIGTSMDPADVARLILWPHSNICTDGELAGRHPRGFGSFPRALRRYVHEDSALTLEVAIHKMTALAARHMGLEHRGMIRPGAYADLVLFDPARISDRATPDEPQAVSEGIERVWVNGVEVFADGAPTGSRPGKAIARSAAR